MQTKMLQTVLLTKILFVSIRTLAMHEEGPIGRVTRANTSKPGGREDADNQDSTMNPPQTTAKTGDKASPSLDDFQKAFDRWLNYGEEH